MSITERPRAADTVPPSSTVIETSGTISVPPPSSIAPESGWRTRRRYPTYRPPAISDTRPSMACEIRVLEDVDDLIQSYRLRYRVYGALGYLQSLNPSGLEIDEYDRYAIPFGAFETKTGTLIGTLRLITNEVQTQHQRHIATVLEKFEDPDLSEQASRARKHQLPSIVSDEVDELLDLFNEDRCVVQELSRTIVHPEHRGSGVSRGLMEFGLAYASLMREPTILIGACLPHHVPMYAKYGYVKLPGMRLELNDSVGQIANTVVCHTDTLPQPTRSHVDALLGRMRAGSPECVLELRSGTQAIYHFTNAREFHASFAQPRTAASS